MGIGIDAFSVDLKIEYYCRNKLGYKADLTGGLIPSSQLGGAAISPASYTIYKDGTTIKAVNGTTGVVDYSGTDASTVIQSAISGGKIFIKAGTYTLTIPVVIANSNISIYGEGQGITIIQADNVVAFDTTAFFKIEPSQNAPSHSLTVNANAGDLTITVSNSDSTNYITGDYIILYSSLDIDTENTGRKQGELHKVISVDNGTGVITIGQTYSGTHVYETTLVSDTAKIMKLTMYENITIDGITFKDTASSRPNTLTTGGVLFGFVRNLTVTNCQFRDMFNSGIHVRQDINVKISNCDIRDIKDVTPSSNVYYGIQVRGATLGCAVANCSFDNMRHSVTQGAGGTSKYAGRTRNITISNNVSIATASAHFDCHQGAEGVSIVNNVMVGNNGTSHGIQTRSPATITGNSIIGMLGDGIMLFGASSGSTVSGNDIKGCTYGILVDSGGTTRHTISGNTIRSGTVGIVLTRNGENQGGDDILITGNSITDNSSYGIKADSQINVVVLNNKFKANSIPIQLLDNNTRADSWMIVNNYFNSHTTSNSPTLNGTNHVVRDNYGYIADPSPSELVKVASANIRNSHDDPILDIHGDNATYVIQKTITLTNGLLGSARFLFDLQSDDDTYAVKGQIYRNGVALGTEQTSTDAYVTKSEDITQDWQPGDTCELWVVASGTTQSASIRNFRIAYDDSPTIAVISVNS